MKANFKVAKPSTLASSDSQNQSEGVKSDVSKEEFEEFVSKAGAAGSFMIFRSEKKEDELGLDQL
jgi:hypothetical protein